MKLKVYSADGKTSREQDFADLHDAYQRLSPHPGRFADFLATMSQSNSDTRGWSDDQLADITAPTLCAR